MFDKYYKEKIISIHHWTNNLFSFKCTRNKNFKFLNGEFTLIGIKIGNKLITRAYSIVNTNFNNYLEFFSIKIENGIFTSILKKIKIFDYIYIGKKSTGTLLIKNLNNGNILWLISSGTGLSPFISILKDYNIYDNYKIVILIHSVKYKTNLCYKFYLKKILFNNFFLKNFKNKIIYYPVITKEKFKNNSRITDIINNNFFFKDLKIKKFKIKRDRFILCGGIKILKDIIEILKFYKFIESSNNKLGNFVIEKSYIN